MTLHPDATLVADLLDLEIYSVYCSQKRLDVWRLPSRGDTSRALTLLERIFSRFSEGFQTRDLLAAAKLLDELRSYA